MKKFFSIVLLSSMLLSCEVFSSMSVQATENEGMKTSNVFFNNENLIKNGDFSVLDMDGSVKYWLSNQSNPSVFPNAEGGVSLVSKNDSTYSIKSDYFSYGWLLNKFTLDVKNNNLLDNSILTVKLIRANGEIIFNQPVEIDKDEWTNKEIELPYSTALGKTYLMLETTNGNISINNVNLKKIMQKVPKGLRVNEKTDKMVSLNWDKYEGPVSFYPHAYNIYRDGILIKTLDNKVGGEHTEFKDTTVSPNKLYNYQITAFRQGNESEKSQLVNVTTPSFVNWTIGREYKVDDNAFYLGNIYKVLQAHTSQKGWEPDVSPTLWQLIN